MENSFVLLSALTPGSKNSSTKKTKNTKLTLRQNIKKELFEPQDVVDLTEQTANTSVILISSDDDSTYFDEMSQNDSNLSHSTKLSKDSGNDDYYKLILSDDTNSIEVLAPESESIGSEKNDITKNTVVEESEEILARETESEQFELLSKHSIPESMHGSDVLVKETQSSYRTPSRRSSILVEESPPQSSLMTTDDSDPIKLIISSDQSQIERAIETVTSGMKDKLLLTSDESDVEAKQQPEVNISISETASEASEPVNKSESNSDNETLFTTAKSFPEPKPVDQSNIEKWIEDTNLATTPKSNRYSEFGGAEGEDYQTPAIDKSTENLLNQIYGDAWRNSVKKPPKSESRLKPPPRETALRNFPQTERKASKPKLGEISTTQIDFKHFTQKVRPDFESTRTPVRRKRDSFIVNDSNSETEVNNTPSFHNFIANTKPKLQLFPPKKSTEVPAIVRKLQEICDPESDESEATASMEKLKLTETDENSLRLEKLRLSSESEKPVDIEKSMENLQISPAPQYEVTEIQEPPKNNFRTPMHIPAKKTTSTQKRKLFSKESFEDNNSLLHECNNDFPEITRLTYNETIPEPNKENQTYVDLVYEMQLKKIERAKKKREKELLTKKGSSGSESLLPTTKVTKSKKLLTKLSEDSSSASDEEYLPSVERKKQQKSTRKCKRTPKCKKIDWSSDSDTDLEEYRDTRTKVDDKMTSSTNSENDVRVLSDASNSSEENFRLSLVTQQAKRTNTKLSFLASLSDFVSKTDSDPEAQTYKLYFREKKEQLALRLFNLYNKEVFDQQIPQKTPIEWNTRMRGTAGFCYNKKVTRSDGDIERSSRIVLSSKVIDHPSRLRDTLLHEMCHAATWIVDHLSDGHGPYWKAWARRAMLRYPELPPIRRCHDYEINTKYTYKCVNCGYSIGRHSKSLDVDRKRCGFCYGQFELLLNKKTKNGIKSMATPSKANKPPSGFALFVKENYKLVREESTNLKHGDVMRILGQKFSSMKMADNNGGAAETEK